MIDTVARRDEIEQVIRKFFKSPPASKTMEQMVEDVVKIIERKNRVRPWDPNRVSFGHYIYTIAEKYFAGHN